MEQRLVDLLRELEESGRSNDAAAGDRSREMLNITRETGVFLAVLVKFGQCGNVLEIGTSNGYSALWLADAVGEDGSVTTVESAPHKVALAQRNFQRAGLGSRIQQIAGEAGRFLRSRRGEEYDFVFLDSDRERYVEWWPLLQRILAHRGLIVVDNAISHAHELVEFKQVVADSDGYHSSLSPLGNGELVVVKDA